MTEQPKKKRGGPQPGSGRPPKDPKDKVVKCYISMTQAHHAATEGDRSGIIRRALDWYPGEVDLCISGVVKSVEFTAGGMANIDFVGGASLSVFVQRTFLCAPGDRLKVVFCDGINNVQKIKQSHETKTKPTHHQASQTKEAKAVQGRVPSCAGIDGGIG